MIQARRHPLADLTAGLYTKRLARGGATLGGGIPIRRSSVEIIPSFSFEIIFEKCYLVAVN